MLNNKNSEKEKTSILEDINYNFLFGDTPGKIKIDPQNEAEGEHPDKIFNKMIEGKTMELVEEEHIAKIIEIFEGFIESKYKEVKEKHNLNLSTKRKIWKTDQREFYYTRIYIDLCNALNLISSGSEEDEIFSKNFDQTRFSKKSVENRKYLGNMKYKSIFYPFLVKLLKEEKAKRKHFMIKCLLNTFVNFTFSGNEEDNRIPQYYTHMLEDYKSLEEEYLKNVFKFFGNLFDEHFENFDLEESPLNNFMEQYHVKNEGKESIQSYLANFHNFKDNLISCLRDRKIAEVLEILKKFNETYLILPNDTLRDWDLAKEAANLKLTINEILANSERVLYYFDKNNYTKYMSGLNNRMNKYYKKIKNIWDFFNLVDNMMGIKNLNEAELNYFNQTIENVKFKQFFQSVLKSNCIKSYFNVYEKIDSEFDDEFASKVFKNFYKEIYLVPLPPEINGFTDSCLITFINNRKRKYKFFNYIKAEKLFQFASLLVTLLHESNHFIRRYFKQSENSVDAHTSESFFTEKGKIENNSKPNEGGILMSENIFGENLTSLNIFQILFLLDIDNWDQGSFCFREKFKNCKKLIDKDYSIEKIKTLIEDDYSVEIKELVMEAEGVDTKPQVVYQKNNHNEKSSEIELGRCLIAIGREKNKDYNI